MRREKKLNLRVCQLSLYKISLALLPLAVSGGKRRSFCDISRPRPLCPANGFSRGPWKACFDACVLAWGVFFFPLASQEHPAVLGLTLSGYRPGNRNSTWGLLPGVSKASPSLHHASSPPPIPFSLLVHLPQRPTPESWAWGLVGEKRL